MIVDYEGLKKILDQFPCGVLLAGEDGEVLLCNDKIEGLLEIEAIDLIEKGLAAVPTWCGLAEAVRSLGRDGQHRQSIEFARGRRHFSLSLTRNGLSLYGKECLVALIGDISRQKELEELRSGFFSEFLRRLKGPLTSVKTALSVLSSDRYASLDREAREVAELGHVEVQRLHALLSDMGDLFSLDGRDAGAGLYLENVEVRAVLTRCLRRARGSRNGADREITAAWPEGEKPMRVVADYEKLGLVLNHLVNNSLAYSPPSSPVRITAREVEGSGEIRITDRGFGIPPEDMPRVFERFFRSMDPAALKAEGGGLGLFIAKGFTEIMGGTLKLESTPGDGTTAIIRLPLAADGNWTG